jgi:hypothetical protein
MASANRRTIYYGIPVFMESPIAGSESIEIGDFVRRKADGFLEKADDDTASTYVIGISESGYDNSGSITNGVADVKHSYLPLAWVDVGVGTIARTDTETACYAHTRNSVRLAADGAGTSNTVIGIIIDVNDETAATKVLVDFSRKS